MSNVSQLYQPTGVYTSTHAFFKVQSVLFSWGLFKNVYFLV